MSLWSNIVSGASGVVSGLVKSIPVVGQYLGDAVDIGGKLAEKYEAQEQLDSARGWQQFMNGIQQQFSADEAQKSRDFNAQEAQKSRAFNAQEAAKARDIARQWQLEDWQRETEYNSPSNQLKLLQDAGINPLLFNTSVSNNGMPSFGSPSLASSSPASSSPVSAPSGGMLSVQNPSLIAAQVRQAEAQADKAEADAEATMKKLPGEIEIQGMTLKTGESNIRLNEANIDDIKSRMKVAEATIRNLEQQTSNLTKQYDILSLDEKEKRIIVDKLEERLTAELLAIKTKIHLDEANIKYIASQIAVNYSQIYLNHALASESSSRSLLNGIELIFKRDNLKLQYDADKDNYEVLVLDNRKKSRLLGYRYDFSTTSKMFLNGVFDAIEILASSSLSALTSVLKLSLIHI